MILVTGATGLVGRALLPKLAEAGLEMRCLVRPSRRSPRLPKGIAVQVAIAHLSDERALRSALVGVDTIIHLAGAGWHGQSGDVLAVDAGGTRVLTEVARQAGVGRFVYLSHLGADRGSAYSVLKAKGLAEEFVRQSGLPHTILRSAVLYGAEDEFVNVVALMARLTPGVFLLPGDGQTVLQPLWVDDLATCLEWSLHDAGLVNQTVSVGGPEFVTFREVVQTVLDRLHLRRALVGVRPPFLRAGAWLLEQSLARSPLSRRWLDYLAASRTCELASLPLRFGLKPARFVNTLGFLSAKRWPAEMARLLSG